MAPRMFKCSTNGGKTKVRAQAVAGGRGTGFQSQYFYLNFYLNFYLSFPCRLTISEAPASGFAGPPDPNTLSCLPRRAFPSLFAFSSARRQSLLPSQAGLSLSFRVFVRPATKLASFLGGPFPLFSRFRPPGDKACFLPRRAFPSLSAFSSVRRHSLLPS